LRAAWRERVLEPLRSQNRIMLDRAIARGEIPATVDREVVELGGAVAGVGAGPAQVVQVQQRVRLAQLLEQVGDLGGNRALTGSVDPGDQDGLGAALVHQPRLGLGGMWLDGKWLDAGGQRRQTGEVSLTVCAYGWQMLCCGEAPSVGSQVSWTLDFRIQAG
jgi:Family of unknown function (DUF6578)